MFYIKARLCLDTVFAPST